MAGLPVVTKLGKGMPARVGGMTLEAEYALELIIKWDEYEGTVLELAAKLNVFLK